MSRNVKVILSVLSVVTLAAVTLAVTGLISANHATSSARQDSQRLSLQVAHQKTATASESRQQATLNKQLVAIQAALASSGHSTAHLGICWNSSSGTATGDYGTYMESIGIDSPVITSDVTTCPTGDTFVGVLPAAPTNGG